MLASLLLWQANLKPLNLAVTDVNGQKLAVPVAKAKATILVFVGVDCPIANRMAPEISRIFRDYDGRGAKGVLVYSSDSVKPSEIRGHIRSFRLSGVAFVDRDHSVAKAVGATVTPQAVVVDSTGTVRYSGRINDLYEEHGKIKARPTRNDLRVALDELLAGKPVSHPRTQLVGCFILGG